LIDGEEMGALDGKTAIITGCGRGFGESMAKSFVGEGATVSICDIIPLRELEKKVGSKIRGNGGRVLCHEADVSNEEQVNIMVRKTLDEFGAVDILVNNVGVAGPTEDCWKISLKDWNRTFDVNVGGTFLCSRAVLPEMMKRGWGRIINLSSITGKNPLPHRTPYSTSKMAIIGFTRTLAAEVGRYGITVNAICPGNPGGERNVELVRDLAKYLGKPFDAAACRREFDESRVKGVLAGKYLAGEGLSQTLILHEDVAHLALFLCSGMGDRITGQDINVDAGTIMW
jgi:NAD(P)-dependent dehydrogenase (short-subunit alcohol dehydrogenase family)